MSPEERGTYRLRQTFRYEYASPARRLRHRLIVVPRAVHGDQVRVDHDVVVRGAAATVVDRSDSFGNHVVEIRADRVVDAIEFEAWALVRRDGRGGETLVRRVDIGLVATTRLTGADRFLAEVARELASAGPPGLPGLAFAERACSWTHSALAYAHDATTVRTTAAEAVAGGRGVCQDYAHVMLALCRAVGLPARYVSGHLVGEGGSHAWVEVIAGSSPGLAVAFDPTHDRRARWGYLTVAVGRDYTDVAPTSGRFSGDSPGVLSARKSLALVEGAAPAGVLI